MKKIELKKSDHIPFHEARRNAFRAMRRGDLDGAIRWTMVMRYQFRMARGVEDLFSNRLRPRPKPSKPAPPAPVKAAPNLPVMLDPDGFSPGGTPNWYLNAQRRERAGLPPIDQSARPADSAVGNVRNRGK